MILAQVNPDDCLDELAAHLPAGHADDEISEVHSLDDVLVVGAQLAGCHCLNLTTKLINSLI